MTEQLEKVFNWSETEQPDKLTVWRGPFRSDRYNFKTEASYYAGPGAEPYVAITFSAGDVGSERRSSYLIRIEEQNYNNLLREMEHTTTEGMLKRYIQRIFIWRSVNPDHYARILGEVQREYAWLEKEQSRDV